WLRAALSDLGARGLLRACAVPDAGNAPHQHLEAAGGRGQSGVASRNLSRRGGVQSAAPFDSRRSEGNLGAAALAPDQLKAGKSEAPANLTLPGLHHAAYRRGAWRDATLQAI